MSNYFRNFDQQEKIVAPRDREFSRILSAAVVNEKFRRLLLSNPGMAIQVGYGGEAFHLAEKEAERVSLIHAASLADFATQMSNISS
jgi:hypothetical protein